MSDSPKLKLDDFQQEAVKTRLNSIVSAGAGSGKTLVLSLRFLALVLEEEARSDEILTLTFTRKAALEMRERIYQRLLAYRHVPRIADELSRFEEASISTLDSFCAKIARSDSLRYGIPPGFVQDNDRCRILAEESALEYLLASQHGDEVGILLKCMGFEQIISDVLVPAALYHGSIVTRVDPEGLAANQREQILGLIFRKAGEIMDVCRESASMDRPEKPGKGVLQALECCCAAEKILESNSWIPEGADPGEEETGQLLGDLCSMEKMGKPRGKHMLDQYLNNSAESWNQAAEILYLGAAALSREKDHICLYRWIRGFQDLFTRRKIASEVLSFQDVAELAVDILRTNLELRCWYKQQYRWIMIDEFQDNNSLQKDLLYLLSESDGEEREGIPAIEELHPGKLFFVGDEKQSIYRFRGADVSVFKGLMEELTRSGGVSLELKNNYRSDKNLISFFNTVFSSVMGTDNPSYEADFSELLPGLEEGVCTPPVTLMYYSFDEKDSRSGEEDEEEVRSVEAEAWHIAERLHQEVEEERRHIIGEDRKERPMRYEDAALLLRSTSNQLIYERAFRRAGVPYTSEAPRSLFLESPVNDLYLFLQVIAYPMDRSAYAALLRSPFCSLDDRSVLAVLSEELAPFEITPEIKGIICSWGDQEYNKFSQAARLYQYLCSLADRVPISRLVRELWYRGGYRYHVLRRGEYHPYLEFYGYFQELAKRSDRGGDTLAGFTDIIRSHLGNNEKLPDLELLRTSSSGVNIMTVHKAKGLEFPVVILANAGGGIQGDREGGIYWSPSGGPLLTNHRNLYDSRKGKNLFRLAEQEQRRREEEAELKRLLYVALTRAQQWCIISGGHTRQNRNTVTPLNLLFSALGIGDGDISEEQLRGRGIGFEKIPMVTEESMLASAAHTRHRDPSELHNRFAQAPERAHAFGRMRYPVTGLQEYHSKAEKPHPPSPGGDPLFFGTLCHRIIEHAVEFGTPPSGPGDLKGDFDRDPSPCWEEAAALSVGFLESPAGRRIKAAGKAESEVPFVMWGPYGDEGREIFVQGQADLVLYWDEYCEVIDFKTDQVFAPENHALQLRIYCDAMGHITGKPARGMLYYLRSGRTWDLEAPDNTGKL